MQSTEVAQIGPGPLKALSFQVVYSVLEDISVLYFEETNRFLVAPVSRVLLILPSPFRINVPQTMSLQ